MNKRSREILLGLMDLEKSFRIHELAEKFQVSERTIRNDINDVNDFLEQHELSAIKLGSNGILLVEDDIELAANLFNQNDFYTYRLSKEERKVLIEAILIQASGYTTLNNMAELLYVSRATVINDLESVKQICEAGYCFQSRGMQEYSRRERTQCCEDCRPLWRSGHGSRICGRIQRQICEADAGGGRNLKSLHRSKE